MTLSMTMGDQDLGPGTQDFGKSSGFSIKSMFGGGASAMPSGGAAPSPPSGGALPGRSADRSMSTSPAAPPNTDASSAAGAPGGTGKETGVKSDVLSKKKSLESALGKKLIVTSGFRPGVANHGTGDAIDLGFGANKLTDSDKNTIISTAINLGFTGIGAEYRAPGGPHIHLDTSHRGLVGWGSDYTSRSLPIDSPYAAKLIAQKRGGSAEGAPKMALGGITQGISIAGEAGREAVVPLPNGRSIPVDLGVNKHPEETAKDAVTKVLGGSSNNEMVKVLKDIHASNKNLEIKLSAEMKNVATLQESNNRLLDKLVKITA